MRRCLHSLIVGVLTFSLAIDAARACGHLRHRRSCAPACPAPVMMVPAPVVWDGCCVVHTGCPVLVADGCGCCGVAVSTVVVGCSTACEDIACGTPLNCCGSIGAVPRASAAGVVVGRPTPAANAPAPPTPTPAEVAPAPKPAEHAPEPLATVPDLAPVAPASATESEPETKTETEMLAKDKEFPEAVIPEDADTAARAPEEPAVPATEPEMEEPAPATEEPAPPAETAAQPAPAPAPSPEPQPEPTRPNPFEEADTADEPAAHPDPADPVLAPREAPADVDPFGPGADSADVSPPPPESEEVVPTGEPPMEEAATDAAPVAEPPIEEAPPFDAPAAEPAAEPEEPFAEPEAAASAAEPLRRWIDETGSFAVVGRLTDARGDVVEILKTDGRSVTVPLVRLSGFDRDYAAAAGPRVAAARRPGPRPTDTAQR